MSDTQKLKKSLNFLDVFCLASGAMISSGLFVLPGIVYADVGPALFISYVLAGFLAVTGVFSQGELVSAMPKSGGAYYFVSRSLGPAVGTIQGIMIWISLILKSSFALVGMVAFVHLVFPQVKDIAPSIPWPGMILGCVFIVLNLFGVKNAGKSQVYLVIAMLLTLLVYIIVGFPAVRSENLVPFTPQGFEPVFMVTAMIFISFGGLLKVASMAEEVKDPEWTIPYAMITSLAVITIFYAFAVFVTVGILGSGLDGSLTPLSQAAEQFLGMPGMIALSVAAIFSFVSTANAGIMAASRYPMALSRDKLLPAFLKKIHERFQVPHASLLLTGGCVILALFLKLEILVELASTVLILSFIMSHISVLILREGKIQNYQPKFRSPLYPWTQIVGTILMVLILFKMSSRVLIVMGVLILACSVLYWFYGRLRTKQKYGLLHVIERLTARDLVTGELEAELKKIIRERDDIVMDRFDRIIEKCDVLDIEKRMSASELFREVSGRIAKEDGVTAEGVERLLLKREEESSTTVNSFVAIPHVIIEGELAFNIVMVRCREGIDFSEDAPEVKAVFILYGSRKDRNFHLKALSAIAQVVSKKEFEENWLSAKDERALKDLVVLVERRRDSSQG